MNDNAPSLALLNISGTREEAITILSQRGIKGFVCEEKGGRVLVRTFLNKDTLAEIGLWLSDPSGLKAALVGSGFPSSGFASGTLLGYSVHEDYVHGYPVLERRPSRYYEADVILVEKFNPNEFITSVHRKGDDEWCWGNYFSTYEAALKNLNERWKP